MNLPRFAAVVGTQRSGTTVLRSVLSTNPAMKTYGEVFIPQDYAQEGGYYAYLHSRVQQDTKLCIPTRQNVVGIFDGYLNHLRRISPDAEVILYDCKYDFLRGACLPGSLRREEAHLLSMMRHHQFKIIHLVRDNTLALRVSALVSENTRVWATEHPEKIKDRTVVVPVDTLLPWMYRIRSEQKEWGEALGRLAITVRYENLFVSDGTASTEVLKAIAKHLNVPNEFNPVPKYRKIGLPLKESIRNLDEVTKALKGTVFEHYLKD